MGRFLKWIIRHMLRTWQRTIVMMIMICSFFLTITWIYENIEKSNNEIEKLYQNSTVDAAIIKKKTNRNSDYDMSEGNRYLMNRVFEDIIADGYISNANLEAVMKCSVTFDGKKWQQLITVRGISSVEGFQEIWQNGSGTFEWLEGYSNSFFLQKYEAANDFAENPCVVISSGFADLLGVNLGDCLDEIFIQDAFSYKNVKIIGILRNSNASDAVFVPLDLLEHQVESDDLDVIFYQKIYFEINPQMNRELDKVVDSIETRLSKSDATMMTELELVVFDDVLQQGIYPIEKTMQILVVLRPIIIGVYFVCMIVSMLLITVIDRKELVIMKLLGTPRIHVLLCIYGEWLLIFILGMLLWGIVMKISPGYNWTYASEILQFSVISYLAGILFIGIYSLRLLQKRTLGVM